MYSLSQSLVQSSNNRKSQGNPVENIFSHSLSSPSGYLSDLHCQQNIKRENKGESIGGHYQRVSGKRYKVMHLQLEETRYQFCFQKKESIRIIVTVVVSRDDDDIRRIRALFSFSQTRFYVTGGEWIMEIYARNKLRKVCT